MLAQTFLSVFAGLSALPLLSFVCVDTFIEHAIRPWPFS